MKQWLMKNKVVIIGVLAAAFLAVSEAVKGGEASIKVLVFSGLIAAAGWVANNLRGQVASIVGLVGNALVTYLTMQENGSVSWAQILIQFILGVLAILSAPAKSAGYEKTELIVEAKKEGEVIQPSPVIPKPKDQ